VYTDCADADIGVVAIVDGVTPVLTVDTQASRGVLAIDVAVPAGVVALGVAYRAAVTEASWYGSTATEVAASAGDLPTE
jgi:hypothetical protein